MPRAVRGLLKTSILALLVLPVLPTQAEAIPAFARKYKV